MTAIAIVNPAARQGACGKAWPEIEAKLRQAVDPLRVIFTGAAGEETGMARAALADGATHFIAVGGDGTVNGVLNGLMDDGKLANPHAVLSPVPAGTANELARALGFHNDIEGAARAAAGGTVQRYDLLEADCTGLRGDPVRRYAFLAVSWGAAAEISYRTSTSRYMKRLGRQFSYYAVTLLVTLTYPNKLGRLAVDGAAREEFPHYTGMICNTEVLGGGMRLAPGADPVDGIADLVLFHDIPRRDILLQKPSWLFEGHHVDHDKVELLRGRAFDIEGPADSLVDADGETVGRLPLSVRVVPQACPVRGLPG